MKRRHVVLAVVAVVGVCACQPAGKTSASGAASVGLTPDDHNKLLALFDSIAPMIKAHNWDAWAAQFTDDATFEPPNHPMVHGRPAIRAWVDSFPPITEFAFTNPAVDGNGNLAWGTSGITFTVTPPGGAAMHDTAKQLIVWRRQADGAWKTVAVSFSSDLPMPTPPPAPAPKK